jgi:hypothetical protein
MAEVTEVAERGKQILDGWSVPWSASAECWS